MAAVRERNTACDIYKSPDEQLKHMSNRYEGYGNLVIPGHTNGGVVMGLNPHAAKHMRIVINPGTDSAQVVDLANVSSEELTLAREIAGGIETGKDGMDLQRNQVCGSLELLAKAQKGTQKQASQTATKQTAYESGTPTATIAPQASILVKFTLPGVGLLPVMYEVAEVNGPNMVLGVRPELTDTTYFPSPEMRNPISIDLGGVKYIGYTTPIRYTAAGMTCVVLMVEEVR